MPFVNANGQGARHVVACRHQLGLEAGRQRVRPEVGDAGKLMQRQRSVPVAPSTTAPLRMSRLSGFRLQDRGPRRRARSHAAPCRACQAASPPMPAAREAQVPPP